MPTIHAAALRAVHTMFDGEHMKILPNMPLNITRVEVDREVADDIGNLITAEYEPLVRAAERIADSDVGETDPLDVAALCQALRLIKGA